MFEQDEAAALFFFEGSMTGYSLTEVLYEQNVMPYTALQIADSQARPRLRCRARMRISRRGRFEVTGS